MRVAAVVVTGCLLLGCTASRERGGLGWSARARVVKAPEGNRCARFKAGGSVQSACTDAAYLGMEYVRRLSTGDEVCLENGFGDAPKGECLARASVADTATGRVLMEVRQAKPDSKWYSDEEVQVWFEEGALVDLYLTERGY